MKYIELSYVNKKGDPVLVRTTYHSWKQFTKRYYRVFREYPSREDLVKIFNESSRIKKLSCKLEKRHKKHRHVTLYFKRKPFVFIIEDCVLVTVELMGNHKHLN